MGKKLSKVFSEPNVSPARTEEKNLTTFVIRKKRQLLQRLSTCRSPTDDSGNSPEPDVIECSIGDELQEDTWTNIYQHRNTLKSFQRKKAVSISDNMLSDEGHSQGAYQVKAKKQSKGDYAIRLGLDYSRLLVAAIDFGTHGSRLMYITRTDFEKHSLEKYLNCLNDFGKKIPTTLLINPTGKDCISFGWKAEENYSKMPPEQQRKHFLFRQFKMMLLNTKDLSETVKIKDFTDKELPAVDVFVAVIRYFKDQLNAKTSGILKSSEIHWIITVPAIWDLRAKQFMKTAAERAGLCDTQISLALEPEAASIYCRRFPVEIDTQRDDAKQIASLQVGSKYLVVDLGGGTVDITAHEVLQDGGLKELYQASGGYYGGACVNDEIMSFFKRLFGAPVLMTLKNDHPGEFLDFLSDIELKKCTYRNKENQKKIIIKISPTLAEAFEKETDCKIENALENTHFIEDVTMKRGKMFISEKLFETFFETSIENIVKLIKKVLNSPELTGVNTLLLVGGYAESPLLKERLMTVFSHKRIVIPKDPSLSVLKGAVIYGFQPEIIKSRVCRYTYGIAKQGIWKEGDPENKKLPERTKRGFYWCDGVFDKHVKIGQVIKVGEFQAFKEYTAVKGQKKALLDFYASKDSNPRFVDEISCTCVGSFVLDLSGSESGGKVLVRIGFGGTDLKVEAKEEETGEIIQTSCNFLA